MTEHPDHECGNPECVFEQVQQQFGQLMEGSKIRHIVQDGETYISRADLVNLLDTLLQFQQEVVKKQADAAPDLNATLGIIQQYQPLLHGMRITTVNVQARIHDEDALVAPGELVPDSVPDSWQKPPTEGNG